MNLALILAGGIGHRTGQDVPKQFICVDNKPIIIHTLQNFQKSKYIDRICVACSEGWEAFVWAYAKQFGITKLDTLVVGGSTRFFSIQNLLDALKSSTLSDDLIIIYDAVRPIITDEILEDAICKAKEYGAAVGVLPCYDTMFTASRKDECVLSNSINRELLFRGMGPEVTTYEKAVTVFGKCDASNPNANLLELLLSNGMTVAKTLSSSKCIKLTTADDIELFQAMLNYDKKDWLK